MKHLMLATLAFVPLLCDGKAEAAPLEEGQFVCDVYPGQVSNLPADWLHKITIGGNGVFLDRRAMNRREDGIYVLGNSKVTITEYTVSGVNGPFGTVEQTEVDLSFNGLPSVACN